MIRFKSYIGIIKILISCLFGGIIFQQSGLAGDKTEPSLTLRFQAPIESPVELPPGQITSEADQLAESNAQDGNTPLVFQRTPAIFFADRPDTRDTYCVIIEEAAAAREVTFRNAEYSSPFSFQDDKNGGLLLKEGNESIFVYQYGMKLTEAVPKRYKRSCYVHPLFDLAGRTLTDDFPQDHFHHRGLSWMWPKVWINGKRYDLWHIYGMRNELEGLHQIFDDWTVRETGPVCLLLGVKNHWALDDGHSVMDEAVLFRVFRKTGPGRAIDVHLKWTAIDSIQISGADIKGYGGFNLRFSPRENTQITTQAGHESSDSDLRKYSWADLSAQFGGQNQYSGAAIFQHPYNPDFPAGWCLRYYGFLGVAWPGTEVVTLNPGETMDLRFRIWVHAGDAVEGQVEQAYTVYQRQFLLEE
jgi:hypothetical protein